MVTLLVEGTESGSSGQDCRFDRVTKDHSAEDRFLELMAAVVFEEGHEGVTTLFEEMVGY